MNTGVELIAAERLRQVEEEGWTPEHDDRHEDGELACAAACYAIPHDERVQKVGGRPAQVEVWMLELLWPWWQEYRGPDMPNRWKPARATHSTVFAGVWNVQAADRIRELAKAGALIAAEIDRLQRASQPEPKPE